MKRSQAFLFFLLIPLLSGCQMGYLMKSGYGQMKLLSSRIPIDEALASPALAEEQKKKLRLSQEAREFAEKNLHLKPTKNYTSFVDLGRPYVTYVVSAAPKWQLTHYQWSYPLMGKMPYKGFFNEDDAKELEEDLKAENLDTYLRGVSAYSTLGWFNDPLLSSMLRYEDFDLVNIIIHETVHATLYIKHAADFNERLATFLGNKGAEQFYLLKEGKDSPTLQKIRLENFDHDLFSRFISKELKSLEKWYAELPAPQRLEADRQKRLQQIQENFKLEVLPQLKSESFKKFPDLKLNNARLLIYKTYMNDLSDFEKLYELTDHDFSKFLEKCKSLENAKDPEKELKALIKSLQQ